MTENVYAINMVDYPWSVAVARVHEGRHVHLVNANDGTDCMCSASPACAGFDHFHLEESSPADPWDACAAVDPFTGQPDQHEHGDGCPDCTD